MEGDISVEDALRKGGNMLVTTPFAISMVFFIAIPFFAKYAGFEISHGIFAGLISGVFFGALYACYATTKWRIWAFSNVTDVHELKRSAITNKYIPKDGSWQEKLEIRTAADKAALLSIQERFNEPYIFIDDITILDETLIFSTELSKKEEPQITLNSNGIKTVISGFKGWEEITEEEVIQVNNDKKIISYLCYQFQDEYEQISLEDMEITDDVLNHLLMVYHNRFQKKSEKILKTILPDLI